jgi:chitodextrinase
LEYTILKTPSPTDSFFYHLYDGSSNTANISRLYDAGFQNFAGSLNATHVIIEYDATVFNLTSLVLKDRAFNDPGAIVLGTFLADNTPPGNVSSVTSSVTHNSVTFMYTKPSDSDFDHVKVFKDGVLYGQTSSTNMSVTGLSPQTAYAFRLVAVDRGDNQAAGVTVNVTTKRAPPSAPTGLNHESFDQAIKLMWSVNPTGDGVTGYNVYRNGTKINTTPVTSTEYMFTGLTNSTTYRFNVEAINVDYVSPLSVNYFATPADLKPPPIPNGVSGLQDTELVVISWLPVADVDGDLAGYNVYRDGVRLNTSVITANAYTVAPVAGDVVHDYYVTSIDKSGNESAESETVSIAAFLPPVKPTVSYTASQSQVLLTWDNVGLVYEVWNRFEGSDYKLVTVGDTQYYVDGLLWSKDHEFWVVSVDKYGRHIVGDHIIARTLDPPPSVYPVLSTAGLTYDSVKLDWTAVGTAYKVYQDGDLIATLSDTSYTVAGLANATTYQFKVMALDAYGRNNDSNIVSVTTAALPSPVYPVLSLQQVRINQASLTWTNVGQSYVVYKDGVSVATTRGMFYTVSGLTGETEYNFKVVAIDQWDRENDSNVLTVTTLPNPPPKPPRPDPVPPPKVSDTGNKDLDAANDQLYQSVTDYKIVGVAVMVTIVAMFVLFFGAWWLLRLGKKKMVQAGASAGASAGGSVGSPASAKGNTSNKSSGTPSKVVAINSKSKTGRTKKYHVEKTYRGTRKKN